MRISIIGTGGSKTDTLKSFLIENAAVVSLEQDQIFDDLEAEKVKLLPCETTDHQQVICDTSIEAMSSNDFPPAQEFSGDLLHHEDSVHINMENSELEPLLESDAQASTSTINENWFGQNSHAPPLRRYDNIRGMNDFLPELEVKPNQEFAIQTLIRNNEGISGKKLIFRSDVKKRTSNEISFVDGEVQTESDVLIIESEDEKDDVDSEKLLVKMKDGKVAVIGYVYGSEAALQEAQYHLASWVSKGFIKHPPKDVIFNEMKIILATQQNFDRIPCQAEMSELVSYKPNISSFLLPNIHLEMHVDTLGEYRLLFARRRARIKAIISKRLLQRQIPPCRHPFCHGYTPAKPNPPKQSMNYRAALMFLFGLLHILFIVLILSAIGILH